MNYKHHWFVQYKETRVSGPHNSYQIQKLVSEGKLKGSDLVSRNGEQWEPLSQVPQLVPFNETTMRCPPVNVVMKGS